MESLERILNRKMRSRAASGSWCHVFPRGIAPVSIPIGLGTVRGGLQMRATWAATAANLDWADEYIADHEEAVTQSPSSRMSFRRSVHGLAIDKQISGETAFPTAGISTGW